MIDLLSGLGIDEAGVAVGPSTGCCLRCKDSAVGALSRQWLLTRHFLRLRLLEIGVSILKTREMCKLSSKFCHHCPNQAGIEHQHQGLGPFNGGQDVPERHPSPNDSLKDEKPDHGGEDATQYVLITCLIC